MFLREVQVNPAEQTNDSGAVGSGFDPSRDIKFPVQFSFLFISFLCFNFLNMSLGLALGLGYALFWVYFNFLH